MAIDPVTGPLTREEFKRLVEAPHGAAKNAIRNYDPTYGRADGEKFRWKVTAETHSTVRAYVEAASQEEADKLADALDINDFDFDFAGATEIISVEPDR